MARDLCWACVVKGLTRRGRGRWWLAAAGGIGYRRLPHGGGGQRPDPVRYPARGGASPLAGRPQTQHYPQLDITLMQPDPAGHELVVNATPLGMKAAIRCRWTLTVWRQAPGWEVVMTQGVHPAAEGRYRHDSATSSAGPTCCLK